MKVLDEEPDGLEEPEEKLDDLGALEEELDEEGENCGARLAQVSWPLELAGSMDLTASFNCWKEIPAIFCQSITQNLKVFWFENTVEDVVDYVLGVLHVTSLSKEVFGSSQDVGAAQVFVPLPKGIELVETLVVLLVIREFIHQGLTT